MIAVLPKKLHTSILLSLTTSLILLGSAHSAKAQMRITEYMYSGANGEFVEFTNVGAASIDITGWSFDDNDRHVGVHSLSGFGIVQPGESVIVTETTPVSAFRAAWNLCAGIKVVGGYTNDNLGRADEINLYAADSTLVDRLTYDDQTLGGPRTQNKSAWVTAAGLGANNSKLWTLSAVGDAEGSYTSTGGDIGSPGKSTRATVSFNPCVVVNGAPTIVLDTIATTNFLDAGTINITSPFAISGVLADSTDPAQFRGLYFTIGDDATPADSLVVTVTSNNTTVVPNGNIGITGTGASRNIKIVPASVGYANLTVTVSDGTNHTDFLITYAASANSLTPQDTRWPTGISDASDGIPLGDSSFVTGDDEQDVLNIYYRYGSGLPFSSFNYANFLNLPDPSKPEVDVEAAASSPVNTGRIYWLGSMSNGKSPFDNKPNRDRIFATTSSGAGAATTFSVAGYASLRSAILAWGDSAGYSFSASAAAGVDSKSPSGFAAEGMVFGPDSTTLYIGLRAPLVPTTTRTKAVIIPILNFESWFNNGAPAGSPSFGSPIELNLGGRGVRDLIRLSNGTFIILAGSPGETVSGAIYKWTGHAADTPIRVISPSTDTLNIEGVLPVINNGQLSLSDLQVITDKGGDVLYNDGIAAKDLGSNSFKKFRTDFLHSLDLSMPVPNKPPTVTITSPSNGASIHAGTKITLSARAADADGQVVKVEFFNNGVLFATDTTAPYELIAADVEPGAYRVTAKATDNMGDTAVSDTLNVTITGCTSAGYIIGEGYTNIPGSQVSDLTNNPAFPNHPSVLAQLNNLEYGPNLGDNYGARLRGYICAPQTGDYVFYISGDDQAGLWLSTDDNPANKVLIAYAATWTGLREYTKFSTQRSAVIHLVKGGRYYVETLHKEYLGADHLSVAWRLPDASFQAPVPGSVLSPYTDSVAAAATTSQTFASAMQVQATGTNNCDTTGSLTVQVAPNPSHGAFTLITHSAVNEMITIRISDASGQLVEARTEVVPNTTIQVGALLRTGLYFAEIIQGNTRQRIKLMKL